jgi:hypothetical protein
MQHGHQDGNLNRVQRNKLVQPGIGRHQEMKGLERNQREKIVRRQKGLGDFIYQHI